MTTSLSPSNSSVKITEKPNHDDLPISLCILILGNLLNLSTKYFALFLLSSINLSHFLS